MTSDSDKIAIYQLSNYYAYYIDTFKVENWVNCFTVDGIFDETELGSGRFSGHDELSACGASIIERVHTLVHLMSNHIVLELTEDSAAGVAFAVAEVIYKDGKRYRFHCRYNDTYRKVGDAWKISQRLAAKTLPAEPLGQVELA